jgi:hypothetical protein
MSTLDRRKILIPACQPSTPRMRWSPIKPPRPVLDGGWWPRSGDPGAELPGLILAMDQRRGPVTRVMLAYDHWGNEHPLRLAVGGRVIRLGWFASMPVGLLTAICANRERVDLLVVPPDTNAVLAEAAMALAATATNTLRTREILPAVTTRRAAQAEAVARTRWESEGGNLQAKAL